EARRSGAGAQSAQRRGEARGGSAGRSVRGGVRRRACRGPRLGRNRHTGIPFQVSATFARSRTLAERAGGRVRTTPFTPRRTEHFTHRSKYAYTCGTVRPRGGDQHATGV